MSQTEMVRHPGADPTCKRCHGFGVQVVAGDLSAVAVACPCVGLCPTCRGTSWVGVAGVKGVGQPVVRCACFWVDQRRRLFDDAHIPARYADATIVTFRLPTGRAKKESPQAATFEAFTKVNGFIRNFRVGEDNRGFVLHGKVGRGKTHLAIACLREVILRYGVRGRFVEFSHLLADLRLSFEKGNTADIVEPLAAVDVLVIDELGKGRNTEFEGTVLDELISRRYNAGRTVIGTTNYEPGEATGLAVANNVAGGSGPTLPDRVSERVYSRLREMCDFIELPGLDYREAYRGRPGGA